MRTSFYLAACILLGGIAIPLLQATSTAQPKPFETATIVSVRRQELQVPPYNGGDNPSDAPLQSEIYAYDVVLHAVCGTYVTHFESPYDFLPAAFTANNQMPVRVGKHHIVFDLGYRQMQMPIAHRKTDRNVNCQ